MATCKHPKMMVSAETQLELLYAACDSLGLPRVDLTAMTEVKEP
jgi:hypothetical protein